MAFAAGNEDLVFVVSTSGELDWAKRSAVRVLLCCVLLLCAALCVTSALSLVSCWSAGALHKVHISGRLKVHQIAPTPSGIVLFSCLDRNRLYGCNLSDLTADRPAVNALAVFKDAARASPVSEGVLLTEPHHLFLVPEDRCLFLSSKLGNKVCRIDLSILSHLFVSPAKAK